MNFTVPVALFGWPLVAVALCALLPARRAVIAAYIAAWLFLPMYRYPIPGFLDWTKVSATSVSLLLGLMLFDLARLASFRPRWFDLPVLAWCLSPVVSSLANGFGLYDGLSVSLDQVLVWGLPYLLGRLYLGDLDGLRDMALGLFIGGLVYVPFCIFELRMSPQLHAIVYGFHQHSFAQAHRFGGWRPTVFMEHGLMVGMWMSMASLVGIWLWISGTVRSIRGIALPWFLVPLVVTALLCKSVGALVLLAGGVLILVSIHKFRLRAPLLALGVVAPLYILIRAPGFWSGSEAVEAARLVSAERAESLETRLKNEDLLAARALERPVFGWGGWGRSRVADESGTDLAITDGLWIIEFGQRGLFGLAAMLAVFLLPLVALARRLPVRVWTNAWGAPAAALATVVALYLLDCIANAMVTPIYALAAGGITGLLAFRGPIQEPEDPPEGTGPTGS